MGKVSREVMVLLIVLPLSMYLCSFIVGVQLGRLLERDTQIKAVVVSNSLGKEHSTTSPSQGDHDHIVDRIYSHAWLQLYIATACSYMHHLNPSVTYTLFVFDLFSRVEIIYSIHLDLHRRSHKKVTCLSIVMCLFQEFRDINVLGWRQGGSQNYFLVSGVREHVVHYAS